MKLIKVMVDAELAKAYRDAYSDAFGDLRTKRMAMSEFLRAFVEDRLREELDFVEQETT